MIRDFPRPPRQRWLRRRRALAERGVNCPVTMQVFCVPLLAVVVGPTKRRERSFEISNVPGISYARARVPERERGLMCARLLRISVIYVARTTILATKVIDAHEQYTRCGEESAEVVLNILGALCDEDDDGAMGDVLYTVRQLYTVAIVRVYVALMALCECWPDRWRGRFLGIPGYF